MLSRHRAPGFTLIELVASAAVITLLMLMLVQMSKSTADTWKNGLSRAEEFRESRRAFEMVTRRLSTATLNTYWDYEYEKGVDPANPKDKPPIGYQRQSELRFRVLPMTGRASQTGFHPGFGVFFQSESASVDADDTFWQRAYPNRNDVAPVTRLDGLLNTWGYFLEVADSTVLMPEFLKVNAPPRYRSRLMEFREDATKLSVYKIANNKKGDDWFMLPIASTEKDRPVHMISENIIALVFCCSRRRTNTTPRLSPTTRARPRLLLCRIRSTLTTNFRPWCRWRWWRSIRTARTGSGWKPATRPSWISRGCSKGCSRPRTSSTPKARRRVISRPWKIACWPAISAIAFLRPTSPFVARAGARLR
jgi:uncharacterized protein (TIGR02599 family)